MSPALPPGPEHRQDSTRPIPASSNHTTIGVSGSPANVSQTRPAGGSGPLQAGPAAAILSSDAQPAPSFIPSLCKFNPTFVCAAFPPLYLPLFYLRIKVAKSKKKKRNDCNYSGIFHSSAARPLCVVWRVARRRAAGGDLRTRRFVSEGGRTAGDSVRQTVVPPWGGEEGGGGTAMCRT